MLAAMTNELTVTSPSTRYWNREYPTTSIRPMRPASRPRLSWSPPSVGLMSSRVCSVKDMGRAPNLSWSARTLELAAVKLPVMLALPAHSAVCGTGSVITRLSSTTAERLRGAGSEMMREVWSQNALLPAELRESRTSQTPLEPPESCCWPEVALVMSEPNTSAGPRMYLVSPSAEQVSMGLAGSSTMASTSLGLLQSKAVYAAWTPGVIQARSLGSFSLPAGAVAVAPGVAVAVGCAPVAAVTVGAGVVAAPSACGKLDLGADVAVPVAWAVALAV